MGKRGPLSGSLHIDKRIPQILAQLEDEPADPRKGYTTKQMAELIGMSEQWLETARLTPGKGPPFYRIGPRLIRYFRGRKFTEWLDRRLHYWTGEYRRQLQERREANERQREREQRNQQQPRAPQNRNQQQQPHSREKRGELAR